MIIRFLRMTALRSVTSESAGCCTLALRALFYKEQFTDDDSRDGSRNVSILAVQPPDAAANPRKFTEFSRLERFSL